MTKENKDYGKSIKAKLLNLSKAEGLSYQPLLIHYMQERLLYRLAQSKYKHCFYLKGGALLYAHEQFKARPTLDIDFLGNSIANDKNLFARYSLRLLKEGSTCFSTIFVLFPSSGEFFAIVCIFSGE